jgi:hypothetical protein
MKSANNNYAPTVGVIVCLDINFNIFCDPNVLLFKQYIVRSDIWMPDNRKHLKTVQIDAR